MITNSFLVNYSIPLFRDGHYLVAGGCSRNLYVWTLETRQLLRVVQMPKKVTAVKHLEFLPDSFDGGANQVENQVQGIPNHIGGYVELF